MHLDVVCNRLVVRNRDFVRLLLRACPVRLAPSLWVALACACGHGSPADTVPADHPPTAVTVADVQRQEVPEVRVLAGDVMPWEVVPLSFKVGGRVQQIFAAEGDQVRKGQVVAAMDCTDYRLMQELAKTQEQAIKPHLERAQNLYQAHAIPRAALDKLESKMAAARIQRSRADAQLSYATLRAPLAGVVLQKRVGVGDLVDPTRPVLVVADLSVVKVLVPVAQGDLARFAPGQQLQLTASGVPGQFTGQVQAVGYAADERTRTFPVTLRVANPKLLLRAGMIAQAEITIATHRGIYLPLHTVTRDQQGQAEVRLLALGADGKTRVVRTRKVVLGRLLGDRVEIAAGLAAGDQLIVLGEVRDGDPVTPVADRPVLSQR